MIGFFPFYSPAHCAVLPALIISHEPCPCCGKAGLHFTVSWLWWGASLVIAPNDLPPPTP